MGGVAQTLLQRTLTTWTPTPRASSSSTAAGGRDDAPEPGRRGLGALGLAAGGGVGKRYRPASGKTFQCRGFGECRMVFSRSEHLARHIR
ncbi:hypothetical protein B0H17DRAFT_1195458 [Mycena rosella]|uniref:C2H2-type domain-containing protein n=1 Tax=Mycena rosella TaxID=1033263 RepID=A0AAD7GM58_MYCRO|nr:hypothetical protein B0H17DRAFT_1195458 [Mycena rosella]